MSAPDRARSPRSGSRRHFLSRVAAGAAGAAIISGARPARVHATASPDWIAVSTQPAKSGGVLTRASAWDPPVLDPRLTNSVGLSLRNVGAPAMRRNDGYAASTLARTWIDK
jgi:hypothetical protein